MKYSAYLFDFDYTLGEATDAIAESFNFAFRNIGLPERETEPIKRTVGLSLEDTFFALTGISDTCLCSEFVHFCKIKSNEIMASGTHLFSDTLPTLEYIIKNRRKVGIVTNKLKERMMQILVRFEIADMFSVIVGGDDAKKPKPAPDGLIMACDILGIDKKSAVYIGDSMVDANTAFNGGFDFIGVTTGATSAAELSALPHIALAGSLSEVLDFIK